MGGQLLRVAALTCILLTMTLEPNFVFCEISTNDTGIFRMVPESFRGYDYLPANVQDGRSVFTCAASCLQADHCTGFVFDQNLTACQLVTEFCGGSMFRPTAGQLYTSKGSCSVDDGYHFVDIGIECEYCIRVSNQLEPGLSYEEARNVCMADGGNLLHFEELRSPDFQNLLQLSDTTEWRLSRRAVVAFKELWWLSKSCGGFQRAVVAFKELWWLLRRAVVAFKELWWLSKSCGGFQRAVVAFKELWWFSKSCGGFQRAVVVFKELWWLSKSCGGFQRAVVAFTKSCGGFQRAVVAFKELWRIIDCGYN
ncbi:hypothetical protein Btru_011935 [Bulinus truncatus]|nr:hypothetical protein Btru_011935 [Bulinus truncatus]